MLIIPAIDLKDGFCVRLTQGEKDRVKVYDQQPVSVAQRFVAEGAGMLHLVDLDGAFSGGPSKNLEIVRAIRQAVDIPIEFGGGVRTAEALAQLIALGIDRIIIGTAAVETPDLLQQWVHRYPQRLAVGIDARDSKVATRGWAQLAEIDALTLAEQVRAVGIDRIIYTDIAQDGMLTGPNFNSTADLAQRSGLKVTASGGIGSLEHIQRLGGLAQFGVDSCIVGKALYEERFTLKQAIEAVR